ncbi:MAG: thymidine phosphorylase [Candidatus Woesearchaeota archaeon]|nr:thymidine phosphorylase [Candidatus Woesearchaeota archaeon]
MKTGPELIEDAQKGRFSLDDFAGSVQHLQVQPIHVAALLGTLYARDPSSYGSISGPVLSIARDSGPIQYNGFVPSFTGVFDTSAEDAFVTNLLNAKVNHTAWNAPEIDELVQGYCSERFAHHHMAALLGAIMVQGLTTAETVALTTAMTNSGNRLSFPSLDAKGLVGVDKHSTGGVGDGTSLVLAPLVAAACDSVYVAMMSGRVLNHTGGTLNKLEAIPGFRVDFSASELEAILGETRCAIFGQTAELAPADKKIYALRDATGCVANDGLIVGSILSKKLAAGVQVLAMDAKFGNGAFLSDYDTCRNFAQLIVDVAAGNGMKARAFTTDMNEPLGMYAGNKLEVAWAVECLNGYHGDSRFMHVTYRLAQEMIAQADPLSVAPSQLRYLIGGHTVPGRQTPYEKFKAMVTAQGGDVNVGGLGSLDPDNHTRMRGIPLQRLAAQRCDRYILRRLNPQRTTHLHYVTAPKFGSVSECGYVTSFDVKQIGDEVHRLGDATNPDVGVIFTRQRGDLVAAGDVLAVVLHDGKTGNPEAFGRYIHLDREPPKDEPLIRAMISPSQQ